jgi:hypothetical protein
MEHELKGMWNKVLMNCQPIIRQERKTPVGQLQSNCNKAQSMLTMKLHSVLYLTEGGKVSYQAASGFLKRTEQINTRPSLFWDVTRPTVVVIYVRFGATYQSHLQGSRLRDL